MRRIVKEARQRNLVGRGGSSPYSPPNLHEKGLHSCSDSFEIGSITTTVQEQFIGHFEYVE